MHAISLPVLSLTHSLTHPCTVTWDGKTDAPALASCSSTKHLDYDSVKDHMKVANGNLIYTYGVEWRQVGISILFIAFEHLIEIILDLLLLILILKPSNSLFRISTHVIIIFLIIISRLFLIRLHFFLNHIFNIYSHLFLIIFTHYIFSFFSFSFPQSNVEWASRWDVYLSMNHAVPDKVHWFSIINSVLIVLFLAFMVAMILVRTLNRDISKYNKVLLLTL
jgi:hypothetical protein